jgi:alcohol dehydrogenase (cytochrome c)
MPNIYTQPSQLNAPVNLYIIVMFPASAKSLFLCVVLLNLTVVIDGTKRGDAYALDGQTGNVLWNKTIGIQNNTFSNPAPNRSGIVWPGTHNGVEAYTANDNQTAYFAVSNMGFNFFSSNSSETGARIDPAFDAIDNGIGNGTITAIDIDTGNIKWIYPTEYPTWVSPLVTNGVVFSGHITATGKPYATSQFGGPNSPASTH